MSNKNPDIIRSIEVKYFRSINTARIRSCSKFNIITGPNDVGKSNLLRALNLFFNESNTAGEDIDFEEEFSQKRLEQVRKESVKGKQFIQVSIEFNRGPFFLQSLPERFKVTKTWYRDRYTSEQTDDLAARLKSGKLETTVNKSRSSLTRYLNRINYHYVPAIKDNQIFSDVLGQLQTVLFESSEKSSSSLTDQIALFNRELANQALELRNDFTKSTGIDASISLPSSHSDLFQAFRVKTDGIAGEPVSLDQRGDGIRVRFIPAILNYIGERSSQFHIWGFEEPENSMEFKRAFELCEAMRGEYSKHAQIFVTTHSPAFIDLSKELQTIYVARRVDQSTVFDDINPKSAKTLFDGDAELGIAQELGHVAMLGKLHDQLQEAMRKARAVTETSERLQAELAAIQKPVILTEGSSDVKIIETAWKKLRPGISPPFKVLPCDTLPANDNNEAGGASVLNGALKTIRPDFQHCTIGIFDNDDEGVKAYGLDNNYIDFAEPIPHKQHKNKRGFALLLPHDETRSEFVAMGNLPIEFLFDKQYLDEKIEGIGLEISFAPLTIKFGGKLVKTEVSQEPAHMKLGKNKSWFAERVVPSLPAEAFVHFEPLISGIEALIEKITLEEAG